MGHGQYRRAVASGLRSASLPPQQAMLPVVLELPRIGTDCMPRELEMTVLPRELEMMM
jgi:hypothetical protein